MFEALKPGFRSLANLKLVVNVVGELKPKRTAAASRGFLATARPSSQNSFTVTLSIKFAIYMFPKKPSPQTLAVTLSNLNRF